jgi:putative mRNA 3-end processing factor
MPAPATAPCWRRARPWRSWRCATARTSPAPSRRRNAGRDRRHQRRHLHLRPAGHVLGSAQIAVVAQGPADRRLRRLQARRDPTCAAFESCPAMSSSPRRPSACRCSATRRPGRGAKLLASVRSVPERAHLVGAYSLGKAQRVMALIREAGYERPIYHPWRDREADRASIESAGHRARRYPPSRSRGARHLGGEIVDLPAERSRISGRGASPIRSPFRLGLDAGAGAGPAEGRRAAAGHLRPCRLGRPAATIRDTGRGEIWVTHGQADALVHWCGTSG